MPRQESGPEQEQATEQVDGEFEPEPAPERVYFNDCYDCGEPVYSDQQSACINTRYRYYLCESCVRQRWESSTYDCIACDEQHMAAQDWPWDSPDWLLEELGDVDVRHRYNYRAGGRYVAFCAEEHPTCEECGDTALIEDWDGEPETLDDFRECRRCRRGPIHDWNYVPPLRFRAMERGEVVETGVADPTTPYLGLELEMENAGSRARQIIDLFEGDGEYVWLKHDGSLANDGVEMVTHPATFEWYMDNFPWDSLGELSKLGARGYHGPTAGTHIHVSSSSFTPAHLFKFLAFHYRNPMVCQTIGQRGSTNYCSWSNWLNTRPHLVEFAKKNPETRSVMGRYVAVNLTEEETVELRYFKGNLSPTRVKKNLQWVDAVYRYTKQVRGMAMDSELDFNVMFDWVRDQRDRYPDLLRFIDDRQIRPDGVERVPVRAGDPDV